MTNVLTNNYDSFDKPKLKPKYTYEKVDVFIR